MSRKTAIRSWILRLAVAAILFQTLFFKFTGAPESVYLFETLGLEPHGRIGSGLAELVAGILLLWPGRTWYGAVLALGVITGAIGAHLTRLGIEVQGDGGTLFGMAVFVWLASAGLFWWHREEAPGGLFKRS